MKIVGQLTGGVAHDFNNLLAVIGGKLELMGERLADDDPLGELIARALAASNRGKTLTHRLLAFSRKHPLQPRSTDVVALVDDMLELMRRTLRETISVQTVMPGDLWTINVDPAQLENALLNLAVNARDAMPGGGRLTIKAENRHMGFADAADHNGLEPGDFVMVSVGDNGTGMAADVIDKAFDPFFTTKPEGSGSGLGLSMVYGFSRQSGGDVRIESTPGEGTVIKLYLPRANSVAPRLEREKSENQTVRGNGECVLVVEYDSNVRELATDLLSSLNYRVLTAEAGPAGLKVMETVDGIELLFTDVVLPEGMDGVELARRARITTPDLRVLSTSGYTEHAINGRSGVYSGLNLLTKPYRKAQLSHRIRHTLERPLIWIQKRPAKWTTSGKTAMVNTLTVP